jgi:proteasome accessory factor B
MSKLERLLNLTAVLLDTRRPLTAEDLREKVDGYPEGDSAFHRAFERDKDDLRVMGIPLRVERVPGTDPPVDGYRIRPDDYYLPDPGLAPDELAALRLASLTVEVDGLGEPSAGREALWKLGGRQSDEPLRAESLASVPADPALVPLFTAITNRRQVAFTYRAESRTVDPWRLSFQRGHWYLSGFDHLRGGERSYRVDRIEGPVTEMSGTGWSQCPTEAPGGRTLQAWELGEDEPTAVRLRVDASHAAIAARQLGPDHLADLITADHVEFVVPVVNQVAFRSFVLGFLEHAEIVEPEPWRADLVSWLTALAGERR